jgi:hypothetical protein
MSASAAGPRVLVTGPGANVSVPPWVRSFKPATLPASKLGLLRELPDITVVQAKGPGTVLRSRRFLNTLAERHDKAPDWSTILFVFPAQSVAPDLGELKRMLGFFKSFRNVEFARGADQAAFTFEEALAKVSLAEESASREDPLAKVAALVAATADLRAESGRLSTARVAASFGLTKAELGRLLGRSRQAVSKTDDAESAQPGLAPFERVARLRAVLPGDAFRRWLHLGNDLLTGDAPIAWIREGRAAEVADLADDMLSGSPD